MVQGWLRLILTFRYINNKWRAKVHFHFKTDIREKQYCQNGRSEHQLYALIGEIINIFLKHLHISQKSSTFALAFATMAQLVEQRIRNAWVAGSSPASGSIVANHIMYGSLFFA